MNAGRTRVRPAGDRWCQARARGPRRSWPGNAPVCSLLRSTTWPLTTVARKPAAFCLSRRAPAGRPRVLLSSGTALIPLSLTGPLPPPLRVLPVLNSPEFSRRQEIRPKEGRGKRAGGGRSRPAGDKQNAERLRNPADFGQIDNGERRALIFLLSKDLLFSKKGVTKDLLFSKKGVTKDLLFSKKGVTLAAYYQSR